MQKAGAELQRAYDSFVYYLSGYTRITSAQGGGRVGVIPIEGFYRKFTDFPIRRRTTWEWFRSRNAFWQR